MKSEFGDKGIRLYLFLFIFCIYFFSAAGNNISSSDQQQVRFAVTQSIIEEGDLSLPAGMRGVKGNYGKDYSWYGIGQPVLAIPFYIIGRLIGGYEAAEILVSLMNSLIVAANGVILFLFVIYLDYSKKTAFSVTLFYAFGTIAWPQSKHPFDHPVEMFFVFLAVFYAHVFVKSRKVQYLLLSSAALGVAFLTRPPAVLALLPILMYVSYMRLESDFTSKRFWEAMKDCTIFSLAFTPFALIQLWYNYLRFSSIFETGVTLMAKKAGIDFFSGTSFITGIGGFLMSPGKGFFYYSPITILIFFSLKGFYKRHKGLTFCILGIIFSYLVFLSRNIYWHGDWSWGPRYLLVITPLLMIPVSDFIERAWRDGKKSVRYMVLVLFGISIGVQIIGVSVDFNRYFFSLQADEGVRFTSVGGNDVPYILEPPPGTYFDWDKSPIVYQAGSALKIAKGMKVHKPVDPDNRHTVEEALRFYIRLNVFDFWWLYALYTGAPLYMVLLELTLLGFITVLSWLRILKSVNK